MRLHPWLLKCAGLGAAQLIRSWMATLDYRVAFYDPTVDPVNPACHGQKIYIFWHENILFPLYLRGHCNLAMLLSQHRDADILADVAYHLGFQCVRGSTNRGGATAVLEMLRKSRSQNLTITPDGPLGPRRKMSLGPIFLSSRLGLPLVLLGMGYDRPWRANSWDRFAVPKPFSRARAVVSPPVQVPTNSNRDQLEHYRIEVERMLTCLTNEAAAWAEAGTRKLEEQPLLRQGAPLGRRLEARVLRLEEQVRTRHAA
jgi:lysophospholipid acyltransferase (LPLAT)-like uncharacterized protein